MLRNTRMPNGTIKRVQLCRAPNTYVSSLGTKIIKGDVILHFSSDRRTGETFRLTLDDIIRIGSWPTSKFQYMKRRAK